MLSGNKKRIFRAVCDSRSADLPLASLARFWSWLEAERLDAPVAHLLHDTSLPDRLEFVKQSCESNLARNVVICDKAGRLLEKFSAAGVSYAPLKGYYLLKTVYSIDERSMNDVDVLIKPEQIRHAIEIAADYEVASQLPDEIAHNRNINSVFLREKDGWFAIHLHWNIINTSAPSMSTNPPTIAADIWDSCRGNEMSSEATLIHLCEHAFKHSFSMMYLFLDIHRFLEKMPVDWRRTFALAERWGLSPVVTTALALLNEEVPTGRFRSRKIPRLTANFFRANGISVINYAAVQKSEIDRIRFLKETFFPDAESMAKYGKTSGLSGTLSRLRNGFRSIISSLE